MLITWNLIIIKFLNLGLRGHKDDQDLVKAKQSSKIKVTKRPPTPEGTALRGTLQPTSKMLWAPPGTACWAQELGAVQASLPPPQPQPHV